MRNIRNKIIIVIGFLFVFFILWNRFIRIRLPKSIFEAPNDVRIIILTVLCAVYIITLIYLIRKILKIKPNPNSFIYKLIHSILENEIFIKIDNMTQIYILNSPKMLFKTIYDRVKIRFIILVISSYLVLYTANYSFLLFMVTKIIPRISVVIIFLVDIFYFQYLHYFYTSLVLLSIPLLFNFLVFLLDTYVKRPTYT